MINETPPPGTHLGGRYRLIEAIGRGGMARVFRAVDDTLGREVAIKLLREPLEAEVARFEREARLMAKLRHPAVVKVYGFGVMDDGRPYLVLELVDEATNLTALLAERGPLPARHAARLMLPIVGALSEAHQSGIVHRDLKPDNILIQRAPGIEAQLRLIDFGIAAWDGPAAERLTRTGELFGTPAYMSPEHSRGTMSAGPASDVWAMGIILFEMVMGRTPFRGPNVPATLFNITQQALPPLDGVPADFAALVQACLHKEPSERLPDASTLLARLEAVARPVPAVVAESEPVSAAPVEAPGPREETASWGVDDTLPPIVGTETTLHLARAKRPAPVRPRVPFAVGLAAGLLIGFVLALLVPDRTRVVTVPSARPVARVAAVEATLDAAVADAAPPDARPLDAAAPPLIDPALAEAEALLAGGAPGEIATWLDRHPDAGDPDARDRLRGLARLASGEVEAGLALLEAVATRRPALAHDEATIRALLRVLGHREAEDAVGLLARLSRRNPAIGVALVERAGDDDYRTRKRAWLAVDAADGDVAEAGHRYYVRNLRVIDCDIRRHAVDRLRELGDPRAIGPIRRMDAREGFFAKLCMDGAIERALSSLRRRRAELRAAGDAVEADAGAEGDAEE